MGTIEDKSGMQKESGRRTLVGSPTKCEEMKGWGGVVVGWGGVFNFRLRNIERVSTNMNLSQIFTLGLTAGEIGVGCTHRL